MNLKRINNLLTNTIRNMAKQLANKKKTLKYMYKTYNKDHTQVTLEKDKRKDVEQQK